MLGFISKEDKKNIIQEVRKNKEQDAKMWKYVMGKAVECLLIAILLFAVAGAGMLNENVDILTGIIFMAIAVIVGIKALIDIKELDFQFKDKKSK